MDVRELPDSLVQIEIGTHEDAGSADSACSQHDSLRWLNYKLAIGRARFGVDEVCMHFTDLIAAGCESIYFGVGVDRGAELNRIGQPLHETAHLAIVRTTHSTTATLATVIRIVRQVLRRNIMPRAAQPEFPKLVMATLVTPDAELAIVTV